MFVLDVPFATAAVLIGRKAIRCQESSVAQQWFEMVSSGFIPSWILRIMIITVYRGHEYTAARDPIIILPQESSLAGVFTCLMPE